MSTEYEIYLNLLVALAIGLLIGLERGWSLRARLEGTRVAGMRTFGIIGLMGGLAAHLSTLFGNAVIVVIIGFAGLIIAIAVYYRWRSSHDVGITTMVSLLVTLLLGVLAGYGELQIAAASAVVLTVLLGLKPTLHHFLERIEEAELFAFLKLLLISVVLLPVLPDTGMGPWQSLNPYVIWLMVVLISSMTFAGYLAVKLAGAQRGLMATALFGGLSSSTAATVSLARMGVRSVSLQSLCARAAMLSALVLYVRVVIVAWVFSPALGPVLVIPMAAMFVTGGLVFLVLGRGEKDRVFGQPEVEVQPFDLATALRFGLVLAAVMVAAAGLRQIIGDAGLIVVSAIAGITDVDAPTLTAAQAVSHTLPLQTALFAVMAAVLVNTISKLGIIWWMGGAAMGRYATIGYIAPAAAGAVASLLV